MSEVSMYLTHSKGKKKGFDIVYSSCTQFSMLLLVLEVFQVMFNVLI